MGLHVTRNIVATVNLLLGGMLTYLWSLLARDASVFRYLHGTGMWTLIAAAIAMTIAAIGAAAHLLRHSTVEPGLRWNMAVGACWFLSAVGVIAASFSNGQIYGPDALGAAVLVGISLLWLSFGWIIRQFLTLESRKPQLIPTRITITETVRRPQTAPLHVVPFATFTLPAQEETLQILRKQP